MAELIAVGRSIIVEKVKTNIEKENETLSTMFGGRDFSQSSPFNNDTEKTMEGIVVDTGEEIKDVKKGDKVIFRQWSDNNKFTRDGKDYYTIDEWSVKVAIRN